MVLGRLPGGIPPRNPLQYAEYAPFAVIPGESVKKKKTMAAPPAKSAPTQKPRSDAKKTKRRLRWAIILVLLAIIGFALYQLAITLWANHQYRLAQEALERFDLKEARVHLDSCLTLRPSDVPARLLTAQTARRLKDFKEADRHLRLALEQGASKEEVAFEQSLLRLQLGDLDGAAQVAHFCADKPDSPEAALALEALIEGSSRALQLSLAKWSIDLWLKHRPASLDQARGLVWRGRILELSEDFPQAIAVFRQAVGLQPDFIPARIALVEGLIRDDPRQAESEFDWLRRHAPKDPDVRFLTARFLRNFAQPAEAGKVLDELLADEPKRVPALLERGRVALDLNQPKEAERWLLQALDLEPEQREINVALSDCLRLAGRPVEAQRFADRAQQIEERLTKRVEELRKKSTEEVKPR